MTLDYTLVSYLPQADALSANDLFLISQKEYGSAEYSSKRTTYQQLCSFMMRDMDDKISATISIAISSLSVQVYQNVDDISALSDLLNTSISAIVKMANCIQVNKQDISTLMNCHISAINAEHGLTALRLADLHKNIVKIGHENSVAANSSNNIYKFTNDKYGHITGTKAVTSSDIASLGDFLVTASNGLSAKGHDVSMLTANATTIGGVKINGNNVKILDDGTLSVASYGIASASKLGLIKVGQNLTVDSSTGVLSSKDTKYDAGKGLELENGKFVLQIAKTDELGGIRIGYEDNAKNYSVKLDDYGKAYVNVPWEKGGDTPEFSNETFGVEQKYNIVSIGQYDGSITSITQSDYLYNRIDELSGKALDTKTFVKTGNGSMTFNHDNNSLKLYAAADQRTNQVAEVILNSNVISGEYVTKRPIVIEEETLQQEGNFIKLNFNDKDIDDVDNIYIDISKLFPDYSEYVVIKEWTDSDDVKILVNSTGWYHVEFEGSHFAGTVYGYVGNDTTASSHGIVRGLNPSEDVDKVWLSFQARAGTNLRFISYEFGNQNSKKRTNIRLCKIS